LRQNLSNRICDSITAEIQSKGEEFSRSEDNPSISRVKGGSRTGQGPWHILADLSGGKEGIPPSTLTIVNSKEITRNHRIGVNQAFAQGNGSSLNLKVSLVLLELQRA